MSTAIAEPAAKCPVADIVRDVQTLPLQKRRELLGNLERRFPSLYKTVKQRLWESQESPIVG